MNRTKSSLSYASDPQSRPLTRLSQQSDNSLPSFREETLQHLVHEYSEFVRNILYQGFNVDDEGFEGEECLTHYDLLNSYHAKYLSMDDNHYSEITSASQDDISDVIWKVEQDIHNPLDMMHDLQSALEQRNLLEKVERSPMLQLDEEAEQNIDSKHDRSVANLENNIQNHREKLDNSQIMTEFVEEKPEKLPGNEDELDDETLRILSDVILAQYREVTVTKERQERDIAIIQSLVFRKRMEEERDLKTKAATTIQKMWRGFRLRRIVLPRFQAAMIRFRKRLIFRRWKHEMLALKHIRAHVMNRAWLMWLVR
jgi:hypothetical protein